MVNQDYEYYSEKLGKIDPNEWDEEDVKKMIDACWRGIKQLQGDVQSFNNWLQKHKGYTYKDL